MSDPDAVITWRALDTMATADRIASEINGRNPSRVLIDEIGVGAGVVDRLRQLGHEVEAVNVGTASSDPSLFLNLRAEIGWRARERFERGEVAIPDDSALISELASLRYEYDQRGRIKLEAKDRAKTRLGRSPDIADAAMLAWHASSGSGGRALAYIGGQIVDLDNGTVVRSKLDW